MKKSLLIAAAACLAATLSCSKDVEVSGVSLNQTEVTLKTGETFTLVATVSPSDASIQPSPGLRTTAPSPPWTTTVKSQQ